METVLPAYKVVGERRYRETSGLYWEGATLTEDQRSPRLCMLS
jgi:hypothetical protein